MHFCSIGYRYSLVKTHSKKSYRCERGIDILKEGIDTWLWVSILKNLTRILEMVLHITGYRYSRVGIDTHLGYRYSIGVSVLKNHSGILEVFQNVTGYRYS
ncbi:hypothetical protein GQ457_15G013600 [Hibiscus cannabinus]